MKNQIEKMKQWCLDNYDKGGDTMVECWSDEDYAALFKDQSTKEAWASLKHMVSIYLDQQADARNSAF